MCVCVCSLSPPDDIDHMEIAIDREKTALQDKERGVGRHFVECMAVGLYPASPDYHTVKLTFDNIKLLTKLTKVEQDSQTSAAAGSRRYRLFMTAG